MYIRPAIALYIAESDLNGEPIAACGRLADDVSPSHSVAVPEALLRRLLEAAKTTLDDWQSGIREGVYEADLTGTADRLATTLAAAELLIAAPAPVYVLGVEGGVVQGMSTNRIDVPPPRIIVCDWDTQDGQGQQIDPDDADNRAILAEPSAEPGAVLEPDFVGNVIAALDKANATADAARDVLA
jgi:hypothetical protein